jgi:NAD(P)-dependent dehydrogenase (short-subunit alcohol dehydrogenase family)
MTKTVLITGASRGVGLEFSRQYADDGWRVHACCRNPQGAAALSEALAGHDGVVHALDVADRRSVDNLKGELGDEALDLLINNAGVSGGDHQTFGDVDYEAWADTMRVNAFGPYRISEALVENVAAGDTKTIVNISSQMASLTECDEGDEFIYRSSKTALNMVSVNLANDLGPRGITVLAFHPGWVRTDMGGPEAPITAQESVTALRASIAATSHADNGRFLNYDGTPLPW